MSKPIVFWYKNYRGVEGYRRAIPISLRFGRSEWHTSHDQWLMTAFDTEKQADREFALIDISGVVGVSTILFAVPPHPSRVTDGVRQDD